MCYNIQYDIQYIYNRYLIYVPIEVYILECILNINLIVYNILQLAFFPTK